MTELDIERLHQVFQNPYPARGEGKTVATLVNVIQSAELLPNGKLAFIYPVEAAKSYYTNLFKDIIDCFGMRDDVEEMRRDSILFKNGCKVFTFPAGPRIRDRVAGLMFDNIFIDPDAESRMSEDDFHVLSARLSCFEREAQRI